VTSRFKTSMDAQGTQTSSLKRGVAEFAGTTILPKKRILELYLNIVEWGPGIFGAEAASRYYFGALANRITREQAVELAEIRLLRYIESLLALRHMVHEFLSECGKWASDRCTDVSGDGQIVFTVGDADFPSKWIVSV
jgi:hypothetical protein